MTAHLRLFGDSRSGNCLKVKWTADYLGLDYDWVETDVMNGASRTETFLQINPAGQVPAIAFDDGRTLSQSNAIITYLAQTHASPLLPSDPWACAKVNEWLFWEQYSHEPYIAVARFRVAYLGETAGNLDAALLEKGRAALVRLEAALKDEDFLAAKQLTLADISLLAYTRMADDAEFGLSQYPAITSWVQRIERELGIEPYSGYKAL